MPASCAAVATLSVASQWSSQASPFCFPLAAGVSKGEVPGAGMDNASPPRSAYHSEMCVPSGGIARTLADLVVSSCGRHSVRKCYLCYLFI